MVSISKLIGTSFLAASQNIYQPVAVPQQAATEQYSLFRFLTGSGPYMQNPGFGIDTDIPSQCQLEQVQLLSRHGERFPSKVTGSNLQSVWDKLQDYNSTFVGQLSFLNEYDEFFVTDKDNYDHETTISNSQGLFSGTSNAMRHGAFFRSKYKSLYDENESINVFTPNSQRVHQTADYFMRGFLGDDYDNDVINWVILTEDDDLGANSLTPKYSCSDFSQGVNSDYSGKFDKSYLTEIKSRLLKGNSGLDLTESHVQMMFDWCAYELNIKGSSPFCQLFTNEEFIQHSYSSDLSRYYQYGPGNNISLWASSQLLNASLTLLTDSQPSKNNGKIWLSFTHDTDIESFHAALGILQPNHHLTNQYVEFPSPYQVTSIVPQGARTYTEKYSCGNTSYVRYIVNDAVIPVKGCSDGPGFSCRLDKFSEYVENRLQGNTYAEACGNDDDQPDKLTFYWDYEEKNYTEPLTTDY